MHSRAYLLLEKEWFKLQREDLPWGIQARPLNEDNMFTWEGTIKGPKDTMWEGGVFKLYLQFSEHYNGQPPEIFFHTIPTWRLLVSIQHSSLKSQLYFFV